MSNPEPATGHGDLPEVPLTVNDLVGSDPLLLGRLLWRPGPYRRPFLFLDVPCECGETHRCGWRWDWGLSPDVVSLQALPCGLTAWLAIDPQHAAEAAEIHADAHVAYLAWEKESKRLKRRRKARNRPGRKAAAAAAEASATPPTTSGSPGPAKASQSKPAAPAPAPRPKRPAPTSPPVRPAAVPIAARLAARRSTPDQSCSSLTATNLGASRQ